MSYEPDPDAWRFREYADGHSNDSPVDLSGREGAPRCLFCSKPVDEDLGCQDVDCLAERADEEVAADIDRVIETIVPNFESEWACAPRSMKNYVEKAVAEAWWMKGFLAGRQAGLEIGNADLREMLRVARERVQS